MKYPTDDGRRCPVCNGKSNWACRTDLGIRVVSPHTLMRDVKNKERPGTWIIEVVEHNGENVVHSTRFVDDICYIWEMSDVVWESGDYFTKTQLGYEMDAD